MTTPPRPIVVDNDGTDLRSLTDDRLADLRMRYEDGKVEADTAIDRARYSRRTDGTYADPEWYHAQVAESRRLGRQIQRVCAEQARRKRQRRSQRSVADHFVDAAREILDAETFETLRDVAVDRANRGTP